MDFWKEKETIDRAIGRRATSLAVVPFSDNLWGTLNKVQGRLYARALYKRGNATFYDGRDNRITDGPASLFMPILSPVVWETLARLRQ